MTFSSQEISNVGSWPIIFLGVADYIVTRGQPFPVGPVDIFQLSQHKVHIVYPAFTSQNEWVFVVCKELLNLESLKNVKLRVIDEPGKQFGEITFTSVVPESIIPEESTQNIRGASLLFVQGGPSALLHCKFDALIEHPGRFIVQAKLNEEFVEIGNVFHYQPTPPLTIDQVNAIKSDPNSAKAIGLELGCKLCQTKFKVYTALERQSVLEKEGNIWQYNIGDEFRCECGRAQYSLRYIKESIHGLLLKRFSPTTVDLSYIHQYAYSQVVDIVNEFNRLLETEQDEIRFQEYVQKHPVMFARFHAKRLFVKPKILGKFQTDFAILDTSDQLLLIELEKPSLRLFKNDGHPTADLMHAYGQVGDWLNEYTKHRAAVLDSLKLKPDQVVAVKGVIIAGRTSAGLFEAMQRHLSHPPYREIDFLTLDDLPKSLLEIARALI